MAILFQQPGLHKPSKCKLINSSILLVPVHIFPSPKMLSLSLSISPTHQGAVQSHSWHPHPSRPPQHFLCTALRAYATSSLPNSSGFPHGDVSLTFIIKRRRASPLLKIDHLLLHPTTLQPQPAYLVGSLLRNPTCSSK